jgi:hypothetical protein
MLRRRHRLLIHRQAVEGRLLPHRHLQPRNPGPQSRRASRSAQGPRRHGQDDSPRSHDESDLERPFLKKVPSVSHRTSACIIYLSHSHRPSQSPFPPSPPPPTPALRSPSVLQLSQEPPQMNTRRPAANEKCQTNPIFAPIPHISNSLHVRKRTHLDPAPHPARMKVIHPLEENPN